MGEPNFLLADLAGSMVAVCLYPLFLVIPGYVAAWLMDLFEFRRRTLVFRIALSLPLSISLFPILTYLCGRAGSMTAVWCLYALCWIVFLPAVWFDLKSGGLRMSIDRKWFVFGGVAFAWLLLALFCSMDLQFDGRSYFPVIAFDYAVRTQFIHAITSSGIPPSNPFFFPGHSAPLRYHYFWLLFGSLVEQAGGTLVGPRRAWIGGTVWGGLGLIGILCLYLRLFVYQGAASLRRRMLAAVALTCVTGLDILPTALLWMLRATGMKNAVFPSVEFWNEQVDSFLWTALWTAHHLAGLIVCLMAFLLISESHKGFRYAVVAGIALASAVGSSIYVAIVFAIFLAVWFGIAFVRKWRSELAHLAVAGVAGLLLLLPYALDLRGASKSGNPIDVWVRPFHPARLFTPNLKGGAVALLNGLLLPVNYSLEFGFFLAAGLVWWRKRRANPAPLKRSELACLAMIATSIVVCTFLRSSVIANNDLGWRGMLIAQFALLLWAVDVITDSGRARRGLLAVLLTLGVAGSFYDVLILRFFPVMADQGITAKTPWMAPDPDMGARNLLGRAAYEWTSHVASPQAVLQYNPKVTFQDMPALLYSSRRFAAGNQSCMSAFGGDPAGCPELVTALNSLYSAEPPSLESVCPKLPIDILVVKDSDPVWSNKGSWVWSVEPLYSNERYRVFSCNSHREPR